MADQEAVDLDRRKFLTVATAATAGVGVVFAAVPFVASWSPSERAKALGAPISVDLSKLEPGMMLTYVWRKQPIYIFKRTPETVAKLAAHDAQLKDPKSSDSSGEKNGTCSAQLLFGAEDDCRKVDLKFESK